MKFSAQKSIPAKYEYLIIFSVILLSAFLYYRDTVDVWFTSDDALSLVSSTDSWKEILFSHNYSPFFYTPLQPISFVADVKLFGLNPFMYHLHNVLVLVLVSFTVYLGVRMFTEITGAIVSALIVLFSPASCVAVLFVTLRQYLYAILFALWAAGVYFRYQPDTKSRPAMLYLALFFSELSFLGKEQFMTLPLVLFVLSKGPTKERFRKAMPFLILLVAHIILRSAVLKGVGGYPLKLGFLPYATTAVKSFSNTSHFLFGTPWIAALVLAPILLKPKNIFMALSLWIAALVIAFIAMPLNPPGETYRYWLIPTVLFALFIGGSRSLIRQRVARELFSAFLIVFFLIHSLNSNSMLKGFYQEQSALTKSISAALSQSYYKNTLFISPDKQSVISGFFISNLAHAYRILNGGESRATFYPIELLAFYPIIDDYTKFYEINNNSILDITTTLKERLALLKRKTFPIKTGMELIREGKLQLSFDCMPEQKILLLSLKNEHGMINTAMNPLFCRDRLNITAFIKEGMEVSVIPAKRLSYSGKMWHIDQSPIPDGSSLVIAMFVDKEGRYFQPSDALFFSSSHF